MSPTPLCAAPTLQFFADLEVQVAAALEVGRGPQGLRRMIPITGGSVRGQGWTARVLPGGADYQLVIGDSTAMLQAHYLLETDAGDRIYVHNSAMRHASPEITAQLMRGEPVDPAQVYFRCHPRFETGSPALSWIQERLFVGAGRREPNRVVMTFFELS